MYLHEFPEPHIHEYDTLTSEERWNEYADVILANPPFMSPKGGIRPHNRFSVKSSRSEVLFVDYMAEHLTPTGRAGIIVPEGVIFQSQNTHKRLRKILVENYLVAVVSLPPGVFNPYSGVKTSILILDPALAKRADHIAFFKVENDGFDLGAQRRPIDANDLPRVQTELADHLRRLRSNELLDKSEQKSGTIVAKSKIVANLDYNLSQERYRESGAQGNTFPLVSIGDTELFNVESGGTPKSGMKEYWDGDIPWITLADLPPSDIFSQIRSTQRTISESGLGRSSAKIIPENSVIVSTRATIGRIAINRIPLATNQGFKNIIVKDHSRIIPEYLALSIKKLVPIMETWASGGTFKEISKTKFCELQIPLPPLEVQQEIVAEIEGYQKVIDGARAVVENYRPHIAVDPKWPLVDIKEIASVESGFGFPPSRQGKTQEDIPFLKVSDMNLPGNEVAIVSWNNTVSGGELRELKAKAFPTGTVIFPKIGAAIATNKKRILTRPATYDNNVMGIVPDTTKLLPRFLHSWLIGFNLSHWASDAAPPSMRKTVVESHKIPLPLLSLQQAIVEEIEAEEALVSANQQLVQRFEAKIQGAIARVWGDGGD